MTDRTDAQKEQIEAQRKPGDPESGQPIPVVTDTTEAEVASARPLHVSTAALIASAVLPGAGHFLAGAPVRGMLLIIAWGVFLGTGLIGRGKLAAIGRTGSLDDYIAALTLFVGLVLVWGFAFRVLLRARRQPEGGKGDSQWRIEARALLNRQYVQGG